MSCPYCGHVSVKCEAVEEEVPYRFVRTKLDGEKVEDEAVVAVLQPVFTCCKCHQSWTDQTGEVIRDVAVKHAREQSMKEIKDCPCCGRVQSTHEDDLIDALHPSGIYWALDPDPEMGGARRFYMHRDRPDDAQPIWQYSCNETIGGCGLEITGYSAQECIDAWNTRKS